MKIKKIISVICLLAMIFTTLVVPYVEAEETMIDTGSDTLVTVPASGDMHLYDETNINVTIRDRSAWNSSDKTPQSTVTGDYIFTFDTPAKNGWPYPHANSLVLHFNGVWFALRMQYGDILVKEGAYNVEPYANAPTASSTTSYTYPSFDLVQNGPVGKSWKVCVKKTGTTLDFYIKETSDDDGNPSAANWFKISKTVAADSPMNLQAFRYNYPNAYQINNEVLYSLKPAHSASVSGTQPTKAGSRITISLNPLYETSDTTTLPVIAGGTVAVTQGSTLVGNFDATPTIVGNTRRILLTIPTNLTPNTTYTADLSGVTVYGYALTTPTVTFTTNDGQNNYVLPDVNPNNASFSEDFFTGTGNWDITNGALRRQIIDGDPVLAFTYYPTEDGSSFAYQGGFSLKKLPINPFYHSIIDIRFKRNYEGTAPTFSFSDDQGYLLRFSLMRGDNKDPNTGISYTGYIRDEIDKKTILGRYNYGEWCDLRIVAYPDEFVFFTKQGDNDYDYDSFMTVPRERDTRFTMSMGCLGGNFYIDTIYGYDLEWFESEKFVVRNSPVVVYVNGTVGVGYRNKKDGATVTSDTANHEIATSNGASVKGVSPGVTTLTITDGETTHTIPVIVRNKANAIKVDLLTYTGVLRMKEGEVLDCQTTLSNINRLPVTETSLEWSSSDENVVSLYGNADKGKTIVAENEGTAVITITIPGETLPLYQVKEKINVIVEKAETDESVKTVVHKLTNSDHKINKMILGATNGLSDTDVMINHLKDIGITNFRYSYPRTGYDSANDLKKYYDAGIDIILLLNKFHTNTTVDELVTHVDEVVAAIGNPNGDNSHIRVEMGNEIYNTPMDIDTYITKATEFAEKVKKKYPSIKLSAPVWSTDAGDNKIINAFSSNPNVDGYIKHIYSSAGSLRGNTAEIMLGSTYQRNQIHMNNMIKLHDKIKKANPTQELWVTEYGHLVQIYHDQTEIWEKVRMQHSKTVGIAIANVEKLLFFAEYDKLDVANYYGILDASGFGMINGTEADSVKLPGYYTFKEIIRLMNNYSNFYKIDKVIGDVANGQYYVPVKGQNYYSSVVYDEVDSWGFGNSTSVKEVVLANRTATTKKFTLEGKLLEKTWEYSDPYAIENFLLETGRSLDPKVYHFPTETGFDAPANEILLPPYSLTVCTVTENPAQEAAKLSASIASGAKNVAVDEGFDLTFNKSVSNCTANITKGDTVIEASVTGSGTSYAVSHPKLSYNTEYTLNVTASGNTYSIPFTTRQVDSVDSFVYDSSYNFTTNAIDYPKEFCLTFDMTKTSESAVIKLHIRGKTISIEGAAITGNTSYGGSVLGRDEFKQGETKNYKLIGKGPLVEIYSKYPSQKTYKKITDVLPHNVEGYYYTGLYYDNVSGITVSNVKVYVNKSNISDIVYTQEPVEGIIMNLWRVFKGPTNVNFTVKNTSKYSIFAAEYTDETETELSSLTVQDETDGHDFTYVLDGSEAATQKIFIFDSAMKKILKNAIRNK